MPMTTGQFSQLLVPGLRKIVFQSYKERPPQYSKIFNMHTSERAFEEDLEMIGLGTMPTKPEGQPTIYQDATQGGKRRYTHISFGLGFRVTVEMYEDDLYGPMRRMSKELGKAGRNVREVRAFNVLNTGFTTELGFPKFGTAEPLFSTAHTLIGGGTLANRAAVDTDLGVAALEAAILLFDNLLAEEGNVPIVVKPKWLIHPPALKQVATEILHSEFRPYTANNEVNAVIRNNALESKMVNYLADPDSWFLIADKDDHDLNFFERTAMKFQNGDDFDTGDAKFKAFQRFSVGHGDWRGTFGSLG